MHVLHGSAAGATLTITSAMLVQMPSKIDWIGSTLKGRKQLLADGCLAAGVIGDFIMMERHDFNHARLQGYLGRFFIAGGCNSGQTFFEHVVTTGEYLLYRKAAA
jgi:hypothetical protein